MGISQLFKMFGGQQQPQTNNSLVNMINQFNQFRKNFNGDPKAQVQQLLDSGQMTQQQFQQLSQAATQFQNMMRGRF